jgi:hypothetical protein
MHKVISLLKETFSGKSKRQMLLHNLIKIKENGGGAELKYDILDIV